MSARPRWKLALLILLLIPLGLGSRRFASELPAFIADYAGDTLWAMLVYWLFAFLIPTAKIRTLVVAALLFSYGIEVSQLWQTDWLDALRDTTLGKLVLGRGFLWSDFLCYTVGILAGAALDHWYFSPKSCT
ncbi:MAG: DUF2809 domain-containing protein [Bacteroidota bacterium]